MALKIEVHFRQGIQRIRTNVKSRKIEMAARHDFCALLARIFPHQLFYGLSGRYPDRPYFDRLGPSQGMLLLYKSTGLVPLDLTRRRFSARARVAWAI